MRTYKIIIRADKYPMEYIVEASSWSSAIGRAIREWKKRFKGSRTTELDIKAFKGFAPVLYENNGK